MKVVAEQIKHVAASVPIRKRKKVLMIEAAELSVGVFSYLAFAIAVTAAKLRLLFYS